jgi:hypothetical protein
MLWPSSFGEGKITAEEMPIDPSTRTDLIRYAPGFGCSPPAAKVPQHPYTIDSLAKFLRETIQAAVKALGEGKITAEEMPIDPKTNKSLIRYAPSFGCGLPAVRIPQRRYTIDSLAKFLGETGKGDHAHDAFKATFGALELIAEGYLTESAIKGLEIGEVG